MSSYALILEPVPYRIEYSPDAVEHLRALTARQRALILLGVNEQLGQQPTVPTRNRKRMRTNPVAQWELRIGSLRVYYDVEEEEPTKTVVVLAVGAKEGNRVSIGGEVIDL